MRAAGVGPPARPRPRSVSAAERRDSVMPKRARVGTAPPRPRGPAGVRPCVRPGGHPGPRCTAPLQVAPAEPHLAQPQGDPCVDAHVHSARLLLVLGSGPPPGPAQHRLGRRQRRPWRVPRRRPRHVRWPAGCRAAHPAPHRALLPRAPEPPPPPTSPRGSSRSTACLATTRKPPGHPRLTQPQQPPPPTRPQ